MRMRQVEAFRAVMMSGGITAAAALLNITQPSVSRLIADLEYDVGFPLFDRRGGRLYPTPQAATLFEAVQRSFAGLDLLEQAARRIRAHPVGTLRIAALPALAAALLPPLLQRFRLEHPEVKVTVEAVGQRAIEERIFLGQADLGLGVAAAPRDGVRSSALIHADYVCVLPPGHDLAQRNPVTIADLDGVEFIGPMHEADALWNGIDQALRDAGVVVRRRLESQSSFPVYAFVAAGLGVTIAEPFSAPLFSRLGVAIRRIEPRIGIDFAVLEPDIGPSPAVIGKLRDAVRQAAKACLAEVARLTAP